MSAWYDRAFGAWYLKLYPHRDLEEARRAVTTLAPWLPVRERILDVATGPGRYLQALSESGRTAVGLDRSRPLLAAAARVPGLAVPPVRGDMRRLPFADASFGAVLCMFTSFGYFGSREAHRGVLDEFRRVTATGGRLVLDAVNPSAVRTTLVPLSVRDVDGHRVTERRRLERTRNGEAVVKDLLIEDGEGKPVERYREEVALYERPDLEAMLAGRGWTPERTFGDYEGGGWEPLSPRLLIVAGRA